MQSCYASTLLPMLRMKCCPKEICMRFSLSLDISPTRTLICGFHVWKLLCGVIGEWDKIAKKKKPAKYSRLCKEACVYMYVHLASVYRTYDVLAACGKKKMLLPTFVCELFVGATRVCARVLQTFFIAFAIELVFLLPYLSDNSCLKVIIVNFLH